MTPFEPGDVVRVPFPYVESNRRRARPALVTSAKPLGPDGMLIWALMITSAERERWPGDVEIEDFEAAGLPIPSIVRTAKIATLEAGSAARIGRIAKAELERVRSLLSSQLAIG